jgi:transcriptional repressor NrdR
LQLRDMDHVAFVRFASVYRDFKDLDEFRQEIDRLSADRQGSDVD